MPKERAYTNFSLHELRKIALMSTCAAALATAAAAETPAPSVQSILSTMNAAGGSETVQWQVAPSYSELFGLGVRGAVGGYVNEDFALGVIVDYAEHREEYLANAGVQLNDSLRIIGTVGLLKESEELTLGEGREDVRQLQYGLSLKGSYDAGIVRSYELNAYHTNASNDTGNVETGELTGLQAMAQLQPSANSNLRLGAGYERAEWDGGETNKGFTAQAIGSHRLSDVLSIDYSARSGQTESAFGLGFTYDLSTPDVQSSKLAISLDRINGRNGISDDTRVAVTWTVGLGAPASRSSDTTMSSMGGMSSIARQDLLAEVMTRPAFLPKRVMARAAVGGSCSPVTNLGGATDNTEPESRDNVEIDATTLPLNIVSLFPVNSTPATLAAGIVDIYVNDVLYSGVIRFDVSGQGSFQFDLADKDVFAAGDTVRVVFNGDGGCSEIVLVAESKGSDPVPNDPEPPLQLCSALEIYAPTFAKMDTFFYAPIDQQLVLVITGSSFDDDVSIDGIDLEQVNGDWVSNGDYNFVNREIYTLNYNGASCNLTAQVFTDD